MLKEHQTEEKCIHSLELIARKRLKLKLLILYPDIVFPFEFHVKLKEQSAWSVKRMKGNFENVFFNLVGTFGKHYSQTRIVGV